MHRCQQTNYAKGYSKGEVGLQNPLPDGFRELIALRSTFLVCLFALNIALMGLSPKEIETGSLTAIFV